MRIKEFSLTFVKSVVSPHTYDAIITLNDNVLKGSYSYIHYNMFPENAAFAYEGNVCNYNNTSNFFVIYNVNPLDNYFIVLHELDSNTHESLSKIWEYFPMFIFDTNYYNNNNTNNTIMSYLIEDYINLTNR